MNESARNPNRRPRFRNLLSALAIGVAAPLSAGNIHFVKIDFPGATSTVAFGINAREDVVGRYDDVDGASHGFLLHKGVFSSIDVPDAAVTLYARAINARGDIVGAFLDADFVTHGYLLRDGQFTQIDVPGAVETTARGLNNVGDVTGNYIDNDGNEIGFILRDGVFFRILVPDGLSTDVWSAQNNGRVMVGDAGMPPDGGLHGFLRKKSGDFQLVDFPGLAAPCTAPRSINQRGDIVGFFGAFSSIDECFSGPPFHFHGFLSRHGKYVSFDFPGSTNTTALAINEEGRIVGRYDDAQGNTHGYEAVLKDEK
jgi:probable HAF family extracellular repeat protein